MTQQDDEDEVIKNLWGNTRTEVIGKTIGRSGRTVRARAEAMGLLPTRPLAAYTPAIEESIKTMWSNGMSAGEIGRKLGLSRNAVIGKVHRLGCAKRKDATMPKGAKTSQAMRKGIRTGAAMKPIPKKPPERKPTLAISTFICEGTVRLEQLTNRSCKFGVAEDAEGHLFCGQRSMEGRVYCPAHCAIAFEVRTPNRKRRSEQATVYKASTAA